MPILIENPGAWKPWFAWFPVCIDGRWAWLQTVERRRVSWSAPGFAQLETQYRRDPTDA